jgi:spore coat protein SA
MDIVQLLPHTSPVDGIQRAALDFTRALAADGHLSDVLALQAGDNHPAWREAARSIRVVPDLGATWRQPASLVRAVGQTRSLPDRPEAVVAHRLDLLSTGAFIARRASAPLILHAHNAPPEWLRWADPIRAPWSWSVDRLVVASRYMRGVWRAIAPTLDIHVVEYPIDSDFFASTGEHERHTAKRVLGIGRDDIAIGFFGRLDPAKGLHVLAEAVQHLRSKASHPAFHVIVQGAPGLSMPAEAGAAYQARCVALLGNNASWLPPAPDTRTAMAACDVVSMPSVWQEPSGLVVSEALSMGTPVIASAVGGIPEQLPSSRFARAVPPNDSRALSDAISELVSLAVPPAERDRLRAHVTARRSPATAGAAYRLALTSPATASLARRVTASTPASDGRTTPHGPLISKRGK